MTFHSPEGTGDSAPVDLIVPLLVTSVSPVTGTYRSGSMVKLAVCLKG